MKKGGRSGFHRSRSAQTEHGRKRILKSGLTPRGPTDTHTPNTRCIMGRKRRKPNLHVTGKTEDGKPLMGGGFRFVDEQGIPLDLLVDRLDQKGLMLDWRDFYRDAMKQGWKPDRTMSKLRGVVGDIYGPKWRVEWEQRMRLWIDHISHQPTPR